jgi:hypothetical protein
MTDLCGLKGGGESCKTTTDDKYAIASHLDSSQNTDVEGQKNE